MTSIPPRILLVEDDPVSRSYLCTALQALPATVDAADSVAAAVALVAAQRYDLWLFDAHLPDGSGIELLLRARARDPDAIALAHTATDDPDLFAALAAAGFREVLAKPLPVAAVRSTVRRALGLRGDGDADGDASTADAGLPVWDDDAAERALNGNRAHIATLRSLFVAELPGLRERVAAAARSHDFEGVQGELHRLRASCGFVGAARLAHATQALHRDAASVLLLRSFDEAAQDTLQQSVANRSLS